MEKEFIKGNPRITAVKILNRVESGESFAEPLLDYHLSRDYFKVAEDRRLLTQLVYGTLRMRGRLDWIVERFYRGRFSEMDTGIKNILRVALYQIIYAERIPSFAAVNEAVEMTKRMHGGRSKLVNGILRNTVRRLSALKYPEMDADPVSYASVLFSHPEWLVEKWTNEIGYEETLALCEANNEIPSMSLRANRLKTSRKEAMKEFSRLGCYTKEITDTPEGFIVSKMPKAMRDMSPYIGGLVQIQDGGSQLVSHLLNPKPGEIILDLCAGVGIKTTHMAELMGNGGSILALDMKRNKLVSMETLAERLGIDIILPLTADATQDLGEEYYSRFDAILVDAPCSGLGTLRRNPEIKWRRAEEEIRKLTKIQRALLEAAVCYLRKGGRLVYSTCTISFDENEGLIESFLKEHTEMSRIYPQKKILEGMVDENGYFRTYPHRNDMDGFFGVLMQKGE